MSTYALGPLRSKRIDLAPSDTPFTLKNASLELAKLKMGGSKSSPAPISLIVKPSSFVGILIRIGSDQVLYVNFDGILEGINATSRPCKLSSSAVRA